MTADAIAIWKAAVEAVQPRVLFTRWLDEHPSWKDRIHAADRVFVVGAGKAGAAMSEAFEECFAAELHHIEGIVNVPAELVRPLKRIQLHPARPAASNHPTEAGVAGAEAMLRLLSEAGPGDMAICLISGGGSALLPAPVEGVSLADKQSVTRLLHGCGATIQEMNAVRKHLSRVKGGGLAQAFRGSTLLGLILSDVVGDPLDVIASGPTATDPTTFADALAVLERYQLRAAPSVLNHLQRGISGEFEETLKTPLPNVENIILGNNALALQYAQLAAQQRGYRVLNLGSFIEGETREVAIAMAGAVRSIRRDSLPLSAPACVLLGGETTVTLGQHCGKGGRNQEFVLAMLEKLGEEGMKGVAILSGGTDGEDGPTDAAGAVADEMIVRAARERGLGIADFLRRHDAYTFFDAAGGLLRTGLTETNVMDVRVILIS